ncbi:MAG: cohesin domain-containing protein [Pyrinomonadaceae bacterium]
MKIIRKKIISVLVILLLLAPGVSTQSGGTFVIKRSVIAGGGGNSTGSPFIMDGTVGQTFGAGSSTGGTFSVGSGFWAGGINNASPSPSPAIGGTVTYANAIGAPNQRYVSNVTISGTGSPNVVTTTDAPGATAGQYLLTGFGAGSYIVTPTKTGGANAITSFDAAKVAQHVAGIAALTGNQLIVADTSGNGAISSFDAGQIGRFVTSNPPFGSAGMWRFIPVNKSYASVTSNVAGEDYGALLMGEVSGNWSNTGARPAGAVDDGQWPVVSWQSAAAIGSDSNEELIVVKAPHIVATVNSESFISISVEGITNKDVIAYEFDLRYDPSVIQPLSRPVDLSATVSRGLTVVVNAEEPGLLRVAVYGIEAIKEDGVLLNLKFTAVGVPGWVSPLTWERIMFNEGVPHAIAADGLIEITAPF